MTDDGRPSTTQISYTIAARLAPMTMVNPSSELGLDHVSGSANGTSGGVLSRAPVSATGADSGLMGDLIRLTGQVRLGVVVALRRPERLLGSAYQLRRIQRLERLSGGRGRPAFARSGPAKEESREPAQLRRSFDELHSPRSQNVGGGRCAGGVVRFSWPECLAGMVRVGVGGWPGRR